MDLLDGFKEVSSTAAQRQSVRRRRRGVENRPNIKSRSQSESYKQLVFSQSAMYLLLATMVFRGSEPQRHKGGSSCR